MPLTLDQYASYLDTRDLTWPVAPEVAAPRAKPHLVRLPKLRAVLWNVYGTLLRLSTGDLVFEHPTAVIMDTALDKTIQEFHVWSSMSRKPGQPSEYLKSIYREVLEDLRLRAGKHPEVCAAKVWEAIVKKLMQKDYQFDVNFFGALNEFSAKIAYFFHGNLQGTACYPGTAEALAAVAAAGLEQGLVADGQCFTMVQLRRGLKAQDATASLDSLIDPKLCALSYQFGSRKPAEALFRHVLDELGERGIAPEQVLHVGSRIEQDVVPAKKLGVRTALFAGDAASVQATAKQLQSAASRPDLLLTALGQIAEVVGSS